MARYLPLLAVLLVLGVVIDKTIADEPEKVVGGSNALPAEFPYQVSLREYGSHFCGGTLVSDRHVVTAAHCLRGSAPFNLLVVTGTISTENGGQTNRVKRIVVHPNFQDDKAQSWKNDIAVLVLAAPIKVTGHQQPISIATVDPPEKAALTLTGWGSLEVGGPQATILQKATVYATGNQQCQVSFPKNPISDTNLCTRGKLGVGICKGDSGGPLVYNGELVGVVSWSSPCALGKPDVYTRVSRYVDFIKNVMNNS